MPNLIGRNPDQVPTNGSLGTMAFQDASAVNILGGVATLQLRRYVPVTKAAAFTVADTESWLIVNGAASVAVTLPPAALNAGREIMIKTVQAFTVVSASSNVVPLNAGSISTAILPATAGKWATLVSDGFSWHIMQAG